MRKGGRIGKIKRELEGWETGSSGKGEREVVGGAGRPRDKGNECTALIRFQLVLK